MIIKSEYLNTFLPFGEGLKALINDSSITESNLNKLLKSRGVFIQNKENVKPLEILATTLLSPREFDFLREQQNYKEDKPKRSTQTISISTQESLLDILPDLNLNEVIKDEFKNYEVCGTPTYEPVDGDPNKVKIEIPLEILDTAKNWATEKSVYKAEVIFEKPKEAPNTMLIKTISTANETKEFSSAFTRAIVKELKISQVISQENNLNVITFDSFRSNEERISFFLKLINTDSSHFIFFQDVQKIGIRPMSDRALPKEIEWMATTSNLMLDGDELHKIFFIDNNELRQHLIFYRMSVNYKFDYHGAKGDCTVLYEFPKYLPNQNGKSEFEIKVSSIIPTLDYKHIAKDKIENWLLEEVTKIQLAAYNSIL